MVNLWLLLLACLCLAPASQAGWFSSSKAEADTHSHGDSQELSAEHVLVTCGSAIKLRHRSGFFLHSHDLKWGSGSGQQSVTAHGSMDDTGSLWAVFGASPGTGKAAANSDQKQEASDGSCGGPGRPIRCGEVLRLRHVRTRNWLHSHRQPTPLQQPGLQEVSAFGDGSGGPGDSGDNWKLVCLGEEEFWRRDTPVRLQHVETGAMLFTSRKNAFTQSNCRGCPILGQLEVSSTGKASDKGSERTLWQASNGWYLPDNRLVQYANAGFEDEAAALDDDEAEDEEDAGFEDDEDEDDDVDEHDDNHEDL